MFNQSELGNSEASEFKQNTLALNKFALDWLEDNRNFREKTKEIALNSPPEKVSQIIDVLFNLIGTFIEGSRERELKIEHYALEIKRLKALENN